MSLDERLPRSVYHWHPELNCVSVRPYQELDILFVNGKSSNWVDVCDKLEPSSPGFIVSPIFADAFGKPMQKMAYSKGADVIVYQSIENPDEALTNGLSQWSSWRFAYSILKGDRRAWSERDAWLVNYLGVSHLFVVSGLHVGFIVVLVVWGAKWLWSYSSIIRNSFKSRHFFEWLLAIPASFAYVAWTGFGEPSLRAFLMASIFLTVRWRAYYLDAMSILLFSAWFLLLCWPGRILSASFWMSFLFVLLILLLIARTPRIGRALTFQILFSLFAVLFTLGWQSEIALMSVLINFLMVPFVAIIWFPYSLFTELFAFNEYVVMLYGMFDHFLVQVATVLEELIYQLPSIRPRFQTISWIKVGLIVCAFWSVLWLPLWRGVMALLLILALIWPLEGDVVQQWKMSNGFVVTHSSVYGELKNEILQSRLQSEAYAMLPDSNRIAFEAIEHDWSFVILDKAEPLSHLLSAMSVEVIVMQPREVFNFNVNEQYIEVVSTHCFQFLNVLKTVACKNAEILESMLN